MSFFIFAKVSKNHHLLPLEYKSFMKNLSGYHKCFGVGFSHGPLAETLNYTDVITTKWQRGSVVQVFIDRLKDKLIDRMMDKFIYRLMDKLIDRMMDKFIYRLMSKLIDRMRDKFLYRLMDRLIDKMMDKLMDRLMDG